MTALRIDDFDGVLENRGRVSPEKAFLFTLYRLHCPGNLVDMQHYWGKEYTQLSRIFKAMVDYIHEQHVHLIKNNIEFFVPWFPQYNEVVRRRIAAKNNGVVPEELADIAVFIDGTIRPIDRPLGNNNIQRAVFNGKDKVHALKFQGLSAPDGMIIDMYGPVAGRHHDANLLGESNLHQRFDDAQQGLHHKKAYADKGYTEMLYIHVAYRGVMLPEQELENDLAKDSRGMSSEFGFGKIVERERYLDFKKGLKIQLQPVAKYYDVACILANAHTCLYGSTQSETFNIVGPTLGQYFGCEDLINV